MYQGLVLSSKTKNDRFVNALTQEVPVHKSSENIVIEIRKVHTAAAFFNSNLERHGKQSDPKMDLSMSHEMYANVCMNSFNINTEARWSIALLN